MTLQRVRLALIGVVTGIVMLVVPSAATAASSWTAPVTLSTNGINATGDGVELAVGPHDEIAAAWTHFESGNYVIQASVSRDAGLTWLAPTTVSEVGKHAEAPRVAINGSGAIMVAWSEETDIWRVRFSTSTDGGATWSTYNTVSNDVDSTAGASLVAAGDHGFVIAMEQYNGLWSDVYARSTPDDGRSWSGFSRLSNGTENSFGVEAAVDGAGNVAAVWLTNKSGQMEIQASASHDSGLIWSGPIEVNPGVIAAFYPSLVASASGGFVTVWESIDGSSVHDLMVSTGSNGGATWSTPVVAASDVGGTPEFAVATGPVGKVAVVWVKADGSTSTTFSVFSSDDGATWSAPIIIASDNSGIGFPFYNLKVVITSQGKTVVAWTKIVDRSGETDLVQSSTSVDDGATWSPMVDVSGLGGGYVNLVATQRGDVIAAWPLTPDANVSDVPAQASTLLVPALPDTGSVTKPLAVGTGVTGALLLASGFTLVFLGRRVLRRFVRE